MEFYSLEPRRYTFNGRCLPEFLSDLEHYLDLERERIRKEDQMPKEHSFPTITIRDETISDHQSFSEEELEREGIYFLEVEDEKKVTSIKIEDIFVYEHKDVFNQEIGRIDVDNQHGRLLGSENENNTLVFRLFERDNSRINPKKPITDKMRTAMAIKNRITQLNNILEYRHNEEKRIIIYICVLIVVEV